MQLSGRGARSTRRQYVVAPAEDDGRVIAQPLQDQKVARSDPVTLSGHLGRGRTSQREQVFPLVPVDPKGTGTA